MVNDLSFRGKPLTNSRTLDYSKLDAVLKFALRLHAHFAAHKKKKKCPWLPASFITSAQVVERLSGRKLAIVVYFVHSVALDVQANNKHFKYNYAILKDILPGLSGCRCT